MAGEAADSVPQPQMEMEEEQRLKYLEFVQAAVVYASVLSAKLYDYAKQNSGPLKPGVLTVEGTVRTVVTPVYDKYHDVPIQFLKFVDRKVDDSMDKLDESVSKVPVPPIIKQVASEVKTAGVASGIVNIAYSKFEPVARGIYTRCEPVARELRTKYQPSALYTKCEPVVEMYAVSGWRSLNKLPLFPQVAQTVLPAAAFCSEKYNQTVQSTVEKGYKVASYLPLVPTDKISKVFNSDGCSQGEAVAVNVN